MSENACTITNLLTQLSDFLAVVRDKAFAKSLIRFQRGDCVWHKSDAEGGIAIYYT